MGDAFNPYAHWLQLPSQRWKPTYYEILGIERTATGKESIMARGKELYAKVKAAPLLGKEKEHKALLAEIEEAVRTIVSNTRRAEYDAHLEPATAESTESKIQASIPTALSAPKVPTVVPAAVAPHSGRAAAVFAMPPMAAPTPAAAAPANPAAIPIANPVALAPVAAPVASALVPKAPVANVVAKPVAPAITPAAVTASPVAPLIRTDVRGSSSIATASTQRHLQQQSRNRSLLIAMTAGGALMLIVLGLVFRGEIVKAFASAPKTSPQENEPQTQTPIPPVIASEENAAAKPNETVEPPAPEVTTPQTPATNSETKPENTPEITTPTPETKPTSEPAMEEKPPPEATPIIFTAQDAAQLAKQCEEIVAALKARDIASAHATLEQAQLLARPAAAKVVVDQLAQVVGPLRVFWNAFDEAYKGLKVDDEIAISASTKVKVSSISETELEIETASGKRKQKKEGLPLGLLLGLVRSKLDVNAPEGKLAVGVFHLTDKSGNSQEGEKLLSEAQSLSAEAVKAILTAKPEFLAMVTSEPKAPETTPPEKMPPETMPAADATDQLILKLRESLRLRQTEKAALLAAQLEKLAQTSDANANLVAEVELAKYAAEFWKQVERGFDGLQGTDELTVGDEVLIVIEKAKSKIICRVQGKRQEYGVSNIPSGIALAIAEKTSNPDSPGFLLAKGALLFTLEKPDLPGAKEAWQAAKSKGAEAADWLLSLTP